MATTANVRAALPPKCDRENPHKRYFLSEEAVLRILTGQDSVIRDESAGIYDAVRLEVIKPVTAAAYRWD